MKIAVLSDLHATGASNTRASWLCGDTPRHPVGGHPIMSLVELITKEQLTADFVLVPGDITDKCDVQGFQIAWEGVRRVAEGLRTKKIFAATGNHDVDSRKQHGQHPFKPLKNQLGSEYPFPDPYQSAYWSKNYAIIPDPQMTLLVLNSVADHTNEADAKHGAVSLRTLEQMEEDLKTMQNDESSVRIAMCHHHPHQHSGVGLEDKDLMHFGDEFLKLLSKYGFGLLVHGHKHHPSLEFASGGSDAPAVFAAGSFSATISSDLATKTRNLFHLIDVADVALQNGRACGEIYSWQFNLMGGWKPSHESAADFPSRAGFGYRGNLIDLSTAIEALIRTNANSTVWSELTKQFPFVRFLIPSDFRALEEKLRAKGIRIYRNKYGEPAELATVVGAGGIPNS
jgi:predicted MPP superfamily phosphohydrolase